VATPDTAADDEEDHEPGGEEERRPHTGRPYQIVAIQARPPPHSGSVITMLAALKKVVESGGRPGREHVVAPDPEAQDAGTDRRERHEGVPTQRTRQNTADSRRPSHCRQHDDVDPGVAEDPEQMLPEQRMAPGRGVEEVHPEAAVEVEKTQAGVRAGSANSTENDVGKRPPHEDRQAVLPTSPGPMVNAVTMKLIAPRRWMDTVSQMRPRRVEVHVDPARTYPP
jgi:hypothetical protein